MDTMYLLQKNESVVWSIQNAMHWFRAESRVLRFMLYVSLSTITHSDLRGRGMGRS